MKENFHILEFKGQIQCQNAKVKDSSLTKINMPMNKHLMYCKTMVSWLILGWWLSWNVNFNSSLGAPIAFE